MTEADPNTRSTDYYKLKLWEKRQRTLSTLKATSYEEPKQVISLQNHRGTSYDTYIQVQNEISAAYREVRDEAADKYFNTSWKEILEGKDELIYRQKEAILSIYPSRISEAEPVGQ